MATVAVAAGVVSARTWAADEDLLFAEIPTVYAAARRAQPMTQAPAAVTVITRDNIREYGYRTLGEALASVPGLYLTNDREYETIGARGLSVPGDFNVRVLFLLNGLPLNDKYIGTFLSEMGPDLLDAVERIEVVKGPASALFGSNALFATINIVTRTGASLGGHALASAEGSSRPLGRGVLTYGDRLPNGLDLFLTGHYEHNAGERKISYGPLGTAKNQDEQKLADLYASARYQDFFVQAWCAERVKQFPAIPFGNLDGVVRDAWYMAEARWEKALDADKRLMWRVFFEDYPYRYSAHYFNSPDDPAVYHLAEHTDDRWVGTEAQFNWQLFPQHHLTCGASFEQHWTLLGGHLDANNVRNSTYPGTDDNFYYVAVYLQDEFRICPTLALTAGARYDAFPDTDQDRFSPRAALVWNVTTQTTVKASYGQAFRAPSQFEATYYAGGGFGAANRHIHPETINTTELVLEQDFRHGLFGRLSLFYNQVDNLIALQPSTDTTPAFYDNDYNVRTKSIEAELTKRFDNGVRGFINGSFQDSLSASLRPPNAVTRLVNSPPWVANFGLVWPICGDKLSLAVRENFVSSRPTATPGQRTENAFLTDLTLTSDGWLRNWSFTFSVRNLLDDRSQVPAGWGGVADAIPQWGRTFLLRATYRF